MTPEQKAHVDAALDAHFSYSPRLTALFVAIVSGNAIAMTPFFGMIPLERAALQQLVALPVFVVCFVAPLRRWLRPVTSAYLAYVVLCSALLLHDKLATEPTLYNIALAGSLVFSTATMTLFGLPLASTRAVAALAVGYFVLSGWAWGWSPLGLRWLSIQAIFEFFGVLGQALRRKLVAEAALREFDLRKAETAREQERSTAIMRTAQMLAHDVRKPFTMLKMALNVLRASPDGEAGRALVSRLGPDLERAAAAVDGMVADLMEIGGTAPPAAEPVEPEALLLAAAQDVLRLKPDADVALVWDLRHTKQAQVDPAKIRRVLVNIAENAVQAMGGRGELRFLTRDAGAFVDVRLQNTGSFVAEEDRARLFEPFFTKGKKGGTGLGLAIARKIVEAHGGRIWCDSRLGAYTEFGLTLPAAPARAAVTAALPAHARELAAAWARPGSPSVDRTETQLETRLAAAPRLRVLLVDDEAVYLDALKAQLAGLADVVTARDPETALLLVAHGVVPDVVITDVDMGRAADGFDLVHDLRARLPRAAICVHSNRNLPDDLKRAVAAGASVFLPKPMSRVHLLKLLAGALDRPLAKGA